MAKEIAKLFITLGMDDKEMSKSLDKLQKNLGQMGKVMTGIGAGLTAAFGLSVKAAEEERINVARLDAMLQNVGVSYDDVSENLEKNIKATQDKTGIADDQQRDMLSNLVFAVGDYQKALDLLPLSLDLMAAKEMDAKTAAELLGKVAQGEFGTLSRYGIILKDDATAADALAAIQDKVAGSAERMASPIDVIKASFGDLMEKVGAQLLPVLKSLADRMLPIIDSIGKWMDDNPELTKTLIIVAAAIGGVFVVLGPLLLMLPLLAAGFTMMLGPVGIAIAAIAGLIALGTLLVMNWDKVVAFFQRMPDTIGAAFSKLKDIMLAPFRAAWAGIEVAINGIINALNSLKVDLPSWIPGIGGKSFGINLPAVTLPKFAEGGIVTAPTVGMLGEAGPEAIIPLSKVGGGMGGITVNIYPQALLGTKAEVGAWIREVMYTVKVSNANSLGLA